jgi:Predicted membrane protein
MFEWLTRELFFKFIKFGVVGFTGVGVDFGTTFFGKEIVKIPKYIANAIGFSVAATSNYFLNRIWTFHSQNPNIGVEFSEFFIISMIGLAINTLILWILVTKFKKNFYLSKLFAIAIVTVWNFFANAFFTFV